MSFIDLNSRIRGGNGVKHHECNRILRTLVRIVRVGCPDIPDENPDSPDLVAKIFGFLI